MFLSLWLDISTIPYSDLNGRIVLFSLLHTHTHAHTHTHTHNVLTFRIQSPSEVSDIEDDRILDKQDAALTTADVETLNTFGVMC